MKHNIVLALASAMLLSGCACGASLRANQADLRADNAPIVRQTDSEFVTYLVLSKGGQYSGGTVTEKDDALFLENFVKFNGAAGSDLPGAAAVTSSSGAKFLAWVSYDGTGALTKHTKVPAKSGQILYAYFEGIPIEGGGEVDPTPTPPPTPTGETVTITVNNAPDWITNDGCVIFAWAWGASSTGAWYACTYGEGAKPTSFSITVPSDSTGCLLARCAGGTTTPDWKKATDGAGRVYNKSADITIASGTTTYTCPAWSDYSPS